MDLVKRVLSNAYVLEAKIHGDERGYFFESFNQERFNRLTGSSHKFVQDNQSMSSKGVLRGLHFQTGEMAQTKLVRVTQGSAFDVAVDLRPESPTYGEWYGVELSASNHLQFLIPRGFAHGFVALEDDTIFQYKVDNYYSKSHDAGIHCFDEALAITWPEMDVNLSEKDRQLPCLKELSVEELWQPRTR